MSMRFAKGVSCTYAGITDMAFCPFCQQGLDDTDHKQFLETLRAYERGEYEWAEYSKKEQPLDWKPRPHPGYVDMRAWAILQESCFRHPVHLRNSFHKHKGIE